MGTRKIATFRLDDDLIEGLKVVQERDGIPPSEQARRGIRMWLEAKGVMKPERKRVAARRRPNPSTEDRSVERAAQIIRGSLAARRARQPTCRKVPDV